VPIRVLRQSNRGQSAARNLAAREARGEYLAFLDQDDRWYPQHLELLVAPLEANAAVGWSYCDFDEMDLGGNLVTRSFMRTLGLRHPKQTIMECVAGDLMVLPSASVLRRTAFEEAGGFDEMLSGYEDDDLFVRIFRLGWEHAFAPTPLVRFRIHASGSSASAAFLRSRMRYAEKLEAILPDDPRMLRDWPGAKAILGVVNHFARKRRSSLRLRWKLFWIQRPRLFRFLMVLNERLPYRARFIRNPTLRLR